MITYIIGALLIVISSWSRKDDPRVGRIVPPSDSMADLHSSTVVEHLRNTLDNQTTRTVCIYCSHNEQADQTPVNIIASMLKQIIQGGHPVHSSLSNLYKQYGLRSTRPSLGEMSEIVRQEFGLYKQVFVILDALDECQESNGHRSRLIEELQKLPGVKMMITSRPHVDIVGAFEMLSGLRSVPAMKTFINISMREWLETS